MFSQSRKVVALGLVTALVGTGVAVAGGTTGADLNDATVEGSVNPSKLDKKKFKPVNLFLGVRNSLSSTGNEQANAAAENIQISKNVKVNLNKAAICPTELANGTTTEQAREICPDESYLGEGDAEVAAPGQFCTPPQATPCVARNPVVSVFRGPQPNQLQLHTYDPDLGAASPVVDSFIVDAEDKGFGQALDVPNAPVTGPLKIISFNATVMKSTKVATAKCDPKTIKFRRTVTYVDGSSEVANLEQKCKVKR